MKSKRKVPLLSQLVISVIAMVILTYMLAGCSAVSTSERKVAIEDFVALQEELYDCYPSGSISYSDEGAFVEIKCVEHFKEGITSADLSYLSYVAEDQLSADMLAARIGCPVLTCDYDENGYLIALQVGYPDAESRESQLIPQGEVKGRIDEIAQAADSFALSKRDAFLNDHCEKLLQETSNTGVKSNVKATYEIESDGIWFNIIQAPGFGYRFKSNEGYDDAVEIWRDYAEFDTLMLRDNVGYRFYTSDGVLDLEATSAMLDYYMNPRVEGKGEHR